MCMTLLDLSDNIILVPTACSLTLQDTRKSYHAQDAHYLFLRKPKEKQEPLSFVAVLAAMRAGRIKPDGTAVEVTEITLDFPHRAYGRKVLEGTASYADGEKEEWRIQVDPIHMRFEWVRQPYNLTDRLYFRIVTPRRTASLQLWHTGSGFQIDNGELPKKDVPGSAGQESELLFYSVHPKNCFRLELNVPGHLHMERATHPGRTLLHEDGWSSREAEEGEEPLWDVRWLCESSSLVRMSASCGVTAATRDFIGRAPVEAADASADFGPFFSQMVLGTLPLNLYRDPHGLFVRNAVMDGKCEDLDAAPLRETIFASESLYLLAPETVVQLLQRILRHASLKQEAHRGEQSKAFTDEECPLLMMAAWRLHQLTGDDEGLRGFLPLLRSCAQHVLALRRTNEAMPMVHETWDPQGVVQGKEPYFVALCHAGLRRLSELEQQAGDPLHARAWIEAARALSAVR